MTVPSPAESTRRQAATDTDSDTGTGGLRREVAVLCATEITAWGCLFYALPVAAGTIAADAGWPLTHVLGAFTVAQLVAGLCGLWVGRRIDRVGPRTVMSLGSLLGGVSLLGIALAQSETTFYLAWVAAGAAMSGTLYAPAFAAITGWTRGDYDMRLKSLTAVTLVAGLASTTFAPLTAWLLEPLGWRGTYAVLAGLVGATALVHLWGLREPWPHPAGDQLASDNSEPMKPRQDDVLRRPDYWLLVAGMTLAGFAVSAVVVNLVPMLTENGLSVRQAAAVLAVGGVGQVAGRLFYTRLAAVTTSSTRAWIVLGVVAVTTAGLAEIHHPLAVVGVLAFLGGTARGLFTLVQATAISDRWGPHRFGARNGVLSGSTLTASALAPWVGASMAASLNGYTAAFWCLALATAAGGALIRPLRVTSR